VNYDIKIIGDSEDNGKIEFERLNLITKSTKALQLRLQSLIGSVSEGTLMTIDCDYFVDTIKGEQLDLFNPKNQLLDCTPMALVINAFNSALNEHEEDIDKPLLKALSNFKDNFISDNEIFYLANRGSLPEVKLTKNDFLKINLLEEGIPDSNKVIIHGKLDEIKVSKGRLGLQTDTGLVTLFAKSSQILAAIFEFVGKEIAIAGMAHYKPNGQVSFVEVQEFSKPNASDKYFSKKPSAMTAEQQLLFQTKQGKGVNVLNAIIETQGLLEDFSDEEFEEMLKAVK
jgi:hypothetical protein